MSNSKALYMNNDKIGYQTTQTENIQDGEWITYVQHEAPEYLIEHELRTNPGKTLNEIVEGTLTP